MRGALAVLAAGVMLLAFATPARVLWAQSGLGWWLPFLVWGAAIAALALAFNGPEDGGRNPP
jgi:hypothetical protein